MIPLAARREISALTVELLVGLQGQVLFILGRKSGCLVGVTKSVTSKFWQFVAKQRND